MVALINPNMTTPRFPARSARPAGRGMHGARHLQVVPEHSMPAGVLDGVIPGLVASAQSVVVGLGVIASAIVGVLAQVSSTRSQTAGALRMLALACVVAGALIGVRVAQGSPAALDAGETTQSSNLSGVDIVLSVTN